MSYVRTKSTKNAISSVIDRIKTLDIASLHHFRPTIYYMFVPAIVFMVFLATSTNTYADPVTLRATIEPVLQVNLDSDLVSLDLSPINSTTAFDNEDLNVTVVTNNQAGYNLSLTASSTDLTRTTALADNTTPTIPTLTTAASADNFPANQWGYRITDGSTSSTVTYLPFTTTINFPAVTTPTDGTNTTINFAAKINDAQPAGTYELDLVFAATARPTTQDFIIHFDPADTVDSVVIKSGSIDGATVGTFTTTGGTVPGLGNGVTYYLIPTFAEDYKFSSWQNDTHSVGTLGTADENGIVSYTIGDQVATGDINSVTLTAELDKLYLQNITSSTCPETATLAYDSRDEEKYMIQKLADGKCWMLDNLRLGGTSSMTLTNADTNITASTYTLPASISNGFSSYNAAQINTDSKATNATYSSNITSSSFNDNDTAKTGVYYNYYAATAGGIFSNPNSSNASANRDICPKGWRMPTGGSSGEYQALYTAYSSDNVNFQTALRTPLSGTFSGSSAYHQGVNGYFWSATRYDNIVMYYLYVNASNVNPQSNYYGRSYGNSIRCVLK